ncbi:MAG: LysM peptidoglycan-binding domain-containing M23 family metallopeptidase [Rickettsiales bacterium]|jgi:hypothetical protein|nr:LysM peptidoglycan-binding domain-containing M23 family metallopeptidase [Rickettsiales bacterium]
MKKTAFLITLSLIQPIFASKIEVKSGDTLFGLAKSHNTTVAKLLECNNLPSDYVLKANDILESCTNDTAPNPKEEKISDDKIMFDMPLQGEIVSKFGKQENGLINDGINIVPSIGKKVLSAQDGKVLYVTDEAKGLGNTVIIQHDNGYITIYSHLSRINVRSDEKVNKGDEIGTVGATGKFDKEQLHFEIRKDLKPVNPEPLLNN